MILEKFINSVQDKLIPAQATIELTYNCNLRCLHCYHNSYEDNHKILSIKDWESILDKLRQAGTLYIVLTGGEPTLSPLLFDFLKYASQRGFHTSLISNGLLLDRTYIQKLKQNGLSHLTISLYSIHPEIHNKMTNYKGSHEKAKKALILAQEFEIKSSINTLITKYNIDSYFELENFANSKNIPISVEVDISPKLNGDISTKQYMAPKDKIKNFFKTIHQKRPQIISKTHSPFICNAARSKCTITASGELLPCVEIRNSAGNLLKNEFDSLWKSSLFENIRNQLQSPIINIDNDHHFFCNHCPGTSINSKNDPRVIDVFTKEITEIKKKIYDSTP